MTTITLSATEIAKLTAVMTGGGFKRAATKEAALKRFFAVAAEKGFGPEAVMFLDAADPHKKLTDALAAKAAPAAKSSPGLARLRASTDAEAIRQSTTADADKARAAVVAGMPKAVVVAGSEAVALLGGKGRKAALELGKEPEAKPAKAKAPKAEKAPKAAAVTGRTKTDATAKITKVVENPKKVGSRSHARFALYKAGKTIQDFIDACVKAGYPASEANADISWDRRKGFITIEDAKAA